MAREVDLLLKDHPFGDLLPKDLLSHNHPVRDPPKSLDVDLHHRVEEGPKTRGVDLHSQDLPEQDYKTKVRGECNRATYLKATER